MRVYVVIKRWCPNFDFVEDLIGIFSTPSKARKEKKLQEEACGTDPHGVEDFVVREMEMDKGLISHLACDHVWEATLTHPESGGEVLECVKCGESHTAWHN